MLRAGTDRPKILHTFSTFSNFSTLISALVRVRNGDIHVTKRQCTSQQIDNALLNEVEARNEELPMSLAWFRRKRTRGGGPPFVRISNRIFYPRAELRRWIAERAVRLNQEVER